MSLKNYIQITDEEIKKGSPLLSATVGKFSNNPTAIFTRDPNAPHANCVNNVRIFINTGFTLWSPPFNLKARISISGGGGGARSASQSSIGTAGSSSSFDGSNLFAGGGQPGGNTGGASLYDGQPPGAPGGMGVSGGEDGTPGELKIVYFQVFFTATYNISIGPGGSGVNGGGDGANGFVIIEW